MGSFLLPDANSGICRLLPSQVELSSHTTERAFLATDPGRTSILSQPNTGYNWYRMKEVYSLDNAPLIVEVCFAWGLLSNLSLSISRNLQGASWSTWSEQAELAKDRQHQDLLERHYGPPPRQFAWGEISTAYDPRGGSSSIAIRYRSGSVVPGPSSGGLARQR